MGDHQKTIRKLEAEKNQTENNCTELKINKVELGNVIENLQTKILDLTSKLDGSNSQLRDVESDLHLLKSEKDSTDAELASVRSEMDDLQNQKAKWEIAMVEATKEKAYYESEAMGQQVKANDLLKQLQESNKARESLGQLLSSIKGANVVLEEKLHSEELNRTHQEREADEHKTMWENEVKSRSKLGVQSLNMEKQLLEMNQKVEEEKKKTRRALDLKKVADSKVEIY